MRPSAANFLALVVSASAETAWVTPHESYSSSVGVLGCKIDTNRVAYWPGSVDCDNICVSLSYQGREVKLLRIDQSGGAYDVSYDAWNLLSTGESARTKPSTGGPIAMEYQNVNADECKGLIKTGDKKLPLSASNSMNYLSNCLAQSGSWVANNYALYNVLDPICTWGQDQACSIDWPTANQPKCPGTLGAPVKLTSSPVYNLQYGTGKEVLAGAPPTPPTGSSGGSGNPNAASARDHWDLGTLSLVIFLISSLVIYP